MRREALFAKETNLECMTECELLAEIVRLCDTYSLLCYHAYDSRKSVGRGFPDLVIIGAGGVVFAELKSARGRLTTSQRLWGYRLTASGQRFEVWRPRDYPERVMSVLSELV
jgi:hypothetical protein